MLYEILEFSILIFFSACRNFTWNEDVHGKKNTKVLSSNCPGTSCDVSKVSYFSINIFKKLNLWTRCKQGNWHFEGWNQVSQHGKLCTRSILYVENNWKANFKKLITWYLQNRDHTALSWLPNYAMISIF